MKVALCEESFKRARTVRACALRKTKALLKRCNKPICCLYMRSIITKIQCNNIYIYNKRKFNPSVVRVAVDR